MDYYGNTDGFIDYHELRNNVVPNAAKSNDDLIIASLIKASVAFDSLYVAKFEGLKTGGRDQIREFPRTGHHDYYGYLIPNDLIPREIENVVYELALIDLNKPGALSIDYTPAKFKQVSVSGAVSVQYSEFSSASEVQTKFAKVEQMVYTLFRKGNADASYSGPISRT